MKQQELTRWIQSIVYSLVIFVFFSIYLYLRRGFYNLYIINKVFGSTAAVLAGLTLLIGPLSKRFRYFSHLMTIRRQLGLVAFGLAIAHIFASLIQQNRFSFPAWYTNELFPVAAGFVATGIWVYMAYISRNTKIKEMGAQLWKKRLSIAGKVSFFAIFLHLVVMKYQGWIRWFQGQVKQTPELANPSYPPASLFVFAIMLGIIVYRIIADYVIRKSTDET